MANNYFIVISFYVYNYLESQTTCVFMRITIRHCMGCVEIKIDNKVHSFVNIRDNKSVTLSHQLNIYNNVFKVKKNWLAIILNEKP